MDNDLLNVFVGKQKKYIDELLSKLILTESQLEVTTSQLKKATAELEELKQELGNAKTSKK